MLGVSSAQALSTPGFLRGLHLDPDGAAAFDDALDRARAGEVGGPYESRLAPEGRDPLIARGTIYPIFGDGERVVGIEGILLDVTGERAIRSRLLESDRLATIGVLAAGVAHEINNPAAFMLLGLDLLGRNLFGPGVRMNANTEPIVRQLVDDLKDAGRRIVAIARDMRTFASPSASSPGRRAMVDVNRAVESALTLARGPISERADLIIELGDDLLMVALDEGRLAQVVVNLLVNAAQAVGEARSVRGALPDGDKVRVATRAAGDAVEIVVEDTGVGLPPDLLERVFLPFFTTRESSGGSGLGLAIIKAIVDGAGGTIRVESPSALGQPPCGTRFVVSLPAELRTLLEEAAVDEPNPTREALAIRSV
jgi:signal transduction histidine kinase